MNEINRESLKQAIRQMDSRLPHANTWGNIQQTLDSEEKLSTALDTLPEHEPDVTSWDAIEHILSQKNERTLTPWWQYAAAVFALLMLSWSAYFFLHDHNEQDIILSYSEEIVSTQEMPHLIANDPLEEEAKSYIQQLCRKARPEICQQPEFLALQAHLEELSKEQSALKKTIDQLGYDPNLIKYQVRIENLKAEATRELIKMVL